MKARMENDVVALILGIIGLALFSLLQGSLFGWLILGFCGCCSFVLTWLGDRNEEKGDYEQKVRALNVNRSFIGCSYVGNFYWDRFS